MPPLPCREAAVCVRGCRGTWRALRAGLREARGWGRAERLEGSGRVGRTLSEAGLQAVGFRRVPAAPLAGPGPVVNFFLPLLPRFSGYGRSISLPRAG